jgi:LysR family transcriptional regulator for bpeEF and oprC
MDPFTGVLPFVHTAEARSFRRAAERLGVTPAAVSKAVAKLEDELGVRLLDRTSRSVALTAEGEAWLARCREALAQLDAGREELMRAARVPKGSLTVSAPFILGRLLVAPLARFGSRYPAVDLHLRFTDRLAKLGDEHVDVAIRLGDLEDSSLVARRLRKTRWVTLASPAYLARRGAPRKPSDLAAHNCLAFVRPNGQPARWPFREGGEDVVIRPEGTLDLDHGELLVDAALADLGVVQILDFMVGDLVRDARLVEILPEFAAEGPPVHALCAPGRQSTARIRAFLEFLVEVFARV